MKITILLTKEFSIKDWADAKSAIDDFIFKEFSKNIHPSRGNMVSKINGFKSIEVCSITSINSHQCYQISIDNYKDLENQTKVPE